MEERRRVLSCECQFLIGSYIFPEDLRDPESSTCTVDLSIPVETGRPPFGQVVENDRQLRSRIAQRLNVSYESESLRGFFRSPRPILRVNGSHEVWFVPPRHLARCGLAGRPF